MRDTLIILAAVASAIAAVTMFLLASDDVTERQNAIVAEERKKLPAGQLANIEGARTQALGEKKGKRLGFVAVPALAAVCLNVAAVFVAPAEPHCGDKPSQQSSPAVTPARTVR